MPVIPRPGREKRRSVLATRLAAITARCPVAEGGRPASRQANRPILSSAILVIVMLALPAFADRATARRLPRFVRAMIGASRLQEAASARRKANRERRSAAHNGTRTAIDSLPRPQEMRPGQPKQAPTRAEAEDSALSGVEFAGNATFLHIVAGAFGLLGVVYGVDFVWDQFRGASAATGDLKSLGAWLWSWTIAGGAQYVGQRILMTTLDHADDAQLAYPPELQGWQPSKPVAVHHLRRRLSKQIGKLLAEAKRYDDVGPYEEIKELRNIRNDITNSQLIRSAGYSATAFIAGLLAMIDLAPPTLVGPGQVLEVYTAEIVASLVASLAGTRAIANRLLQNGAQSAKKAGIKVDNRLISKD